MGNCMERYMFKVVAKHCVTLAERCVSLVPRLKLTNMHLRIKLNYCERLLLPWTWMRYCVEFVKDLKHCWSLIRIMFGA